MNTPKNYISSYQSILSTFLELKKDSKKISLSVSIFQSMFIETLTVDLSSISSLYILLKDLDNES